jgi:mannose-6-phosphate isomerase-like protein (cupin superfamily)
LVNSIQGHDCYSNNSLSTHIYHILDGKGEFIIDDKIVPVEAGSMVVIPPNVTFYYSGRMLMQLEMTPNFVEEHDHCVKKVSYDTNIVNECIKRI